MNTRTLIATLATIAITSVAAGAQQQPAPKYARDLPAKLVKEAKVTEDVAAATALKAVPGGKIDKMELEKEGGKLLYSYDIKVAGKTGVEEVHVDAMTGKLLSNEHESPADEKAEKAKEAKAATPAKPAPKKP
ncbi:MAG TPA: PepSY domain-containing protein [Gemmatimonadaceae bacterium]|jgi:uncharacterized membrane protein YkoI